MKKLLLLLTIVFILALSGCDYPNEVVSKESGITATRFNHVTMGNDYSAITTLEDTETGCVYILYDRGIAPLYDINGNVTGCKNIPTESTK